MSSGSTDRGDRELPLFDLPLRGESEADGPRDESPPARSPEEGPSEPPENLVLFEEGDGEERGDEPVEEPTFEEEESGVPGIVDRLTAGLADLGVQALALGAGILGSLWLGAPLDLSSWPAFLGLGLSFSFLYWVVPLAFWGRTPGMAWLGQVARAEGDRPLTFGQSGWRWLGALVTLGLAGTPQILLLGGRSLGDLLSSSRVVVDYQSQR